jgi:hypothetical protein
LLYILKIQNVENFTRLDKALTDKKQRNMKNSKFFFFFIDFHTMFRRFKNGEKKQKIFSPFLKI